MVAMMQSLLSAHQEPQHAVFMTNIAGADIHATTPHRPANKPRALTMLGTHF
jgi:hypothetical protein